MSHTWKPPDSHQEGRIGGNHSFGLFHTQDATPEEPVDVSARVKVYSIQPIRPGEYRRMASHCVSSIRIMGRQATYDLRATYVEA